MKEWLDSVEHLDFLFGEPSSANRIDPNKTAKKCFVLKDEGLSLSNKLEQKRVAKECAAWIEQKVDIKTIRQVNLLHGKMYHVANSGVEEAIVGSSNFTVSGMGLGNGGNNIELNLIVDSNRDRQELKQWFTDVWNDEKLVSFASPSPMCQTSSRRSWRNVESVRSIILNQLSHSGAPDFKADEVTDAIKVVRSILTLLSHGTHPR